MSFSQFIKISQLYGNYRKNSIKISENSFNSHPKSLKLSIFRPNKLFKIFKNNKI